MRRPELRTVACPLARLPAYLPNWVHFLNLGKKTSKDNFDRCAGEPQAVDLALSHAFFL